jgi:hypothetical protein
MSSDPDQPGPPAGPRPIDWVRAATLYARGARTGEIARTVGCSRSQAARKRRQDPLFQALIEALKPAAAGSRLETLTESVQRAIEAEVRGGNVRVVLWLADRLKLLSPKERAAQADLEALLRGLSREELREFESLRDLAG